ncbi:MAG: hypothetical protein RL367_383 [Pseudomonadota bacterium]|jgi:type IV secretion system protein VirB10
MNRNARNQSSGDPRRTLGANALGAAQSNGYPVVASQLVRRDRAGLMLGGSIALLLGAATLFAMTGSRSGPVPTQAAPPATVIAPPVPTITPVAPVAAPVPVPPPVVAKPVPPVGLPAPVNARQIAVNIALERARAPSLIVDNGPGGGSVAVPVLAAAAKPAQQGLSGEELFAQRLTGEDQTASAVRMANPGMTVAQGTLMSAVLETALDSDLPGYVRAIISRDVKSYDGSRVLIPRSSRVIGQYKSELAVGQTRAYVLWTRLIRPDGVSIALGSPATDSAGRNGLSGKVSSHFGKRFGSAILLSMIGATGQAIGGGNSAVIVAGPQAAASATAQRDLNIPPTVHVKQGQPIRIFTARDLDFATVDP